MRVTAGRRVEPGAAARDGGEGAVEIADGDVVRIEFDGGIQLWMRTEDLLRERGRRAPARDGGGDVWDIDTTVAAGAGAERGLFKIGVKVLEFFGVDLKAEVASRLAVEVEERLLKGNAPGLYRCTLRAGDALQPLADARGFGPGQPILVFLHGTMSSFRGSFAALESQADDDAGRAAAKLREELHARFGDRMLAWEHRTLSQSPIRNALELVEKLPDGAELHLVSHSRGGLVGELLCLAGRDGAGSPLPSGLLDRLFAADRTAATALGLPALSEDEAKARDAVYAEDKARLQRLVELLDAKRVQVRRFVRVACPARGTTLASGRLDRWLSVLDALVPDGLFGDSVDFLLGVIKKRTDPRTMPGIEAMLPGSALTRLLQQSGLRTSADLSVIAGDVEGDSRWGRFKLLAVDWFYGGEHDLVVNTGSMSGGLKRSDKGARWRMDRGPGVNHFNYFRNLESLRWLRSGLLRADDDPAGFLPIAEAPAEEPRWRSAVRASRDTATSRPIVVVVPGTMGSSLTSGGRRIWLDYLALLTGGIADIGWDAPAVEPTGLLDDFYGPLLEHLARDHRVEIFAYDWRRSVRDNARLLARQLGALLPEAERTRQPLHILAHSMGGLVARAMIADGGDGAALWQRMGRLERGSRLLMLGTPNRGSHEAVRWLTGHNPTQSKLILLDLAHGADALIGIVRRFPGLVELLPFDAEPNPYGRREFWEALRRDSGAGFPVVDDATLAAAADTWRRLRDAPPDPARMIYVAGCARATVVGHELEAVEDSSTRRRIDWIASAEGDGTVTWDSGRLAGVPMYWAEDTAHDELCANADDRRIFRGYVELLGSGRTGELRATPPLRSRAGAETPARFVLPPQAVLDDLPDEAQVRALGFSGAPPRRRRRVVRTPLDVSVRHVDLAYARHPVLVGHYVGDTIVSAEAALDTRFGGALSRRLALGLYPGPAGTHAVFFNDDPARSPSAALVVGLGQVGDLAAGRLLTGVRDAMLEFAVQQVGRRSAGDAGTGIAFSALLVGTGGAGLSVRESVEAITGGALAANRRLEEAGLDGQVRIDAIEFIELYEDVAIGAAHAVAAVAGGAEFGEAVRWSPAILADGPGRGTRRTFEADRAWDQRIEILRDRDTGRLHFTVAGQRARAERQLATGQLRLAQGFVAQSIGTTAARGGIERTLYEMLWPVALKQTAIDQRGMVLLLDGETAALPWELMDDGAGDGTPPAIRAGMLRQFKTDSFRERPVQAPEPNALVVGDPDLAGDPSFADLPGARLEAEAVRDALRRHLGDDRVMALIGEREGTIASALHARPWRILHLAGHGVHAWRDPARPGAPPASGMVIGPGSFLTPGDVQQMRYTPDFVFINCCHLGATGGSAPRDAHVLAANLGAQFIEMGVRAVVCAGWAVDDKAATDFASRLYDELLRGTTFRDAVRHARRHARQANPDRNSWGAYQCYGDPGWRLVGDGAGSAAAAPRPYVSVSELIADLDNLAEQARVQMRRDRVADDAVAARQRDAIARTLGRLPADRRDAWLARADVAAALGFAHGEALLFDDAVRWLDVARLSAEGDCPIRAVEQRANFAVRAAAERWQRLRASGQATPAAQQALADEIEEVMRDLDFIATRATTSERLSLLGSACKRLAWVVDATAPRLEALLNMAQYYRMAFEARHGDDAYALANWGYACALVARLDPQAPGSDAWIPALRAMLAEQTRRTAARLAADPDFWAAAGLGDLVLVELLLDADDAAACARHGAVIAGHYRAAVARGASPRKVASVRENVDALLDLTAAGWPPALHAALQVAREVL
ncbi:MAG: CHAT domain-containing protein [Rubrivivax sp.]|nr:CHAT domain-containing protein [Rubrivivax sp.]